ncbi:MAG: TDP-N-acetylfucosamine:lipid II N-acetylfucosaminyltransferase [bacterium]
MKKTILHIIKDDKFFDLVLPKFDLVDNYNNVYLLYVKNKEYQYKYIKNIDRVTMVNDWQDVCEMLSSNAVYAIYFHSLDNNKYKWLELINIETIVICWFWGFELYSTSVRKGLIELNCFKPITKRDFFIRYRGFRLLLKDIINAIIFKATREYNKRISMLNRIDYIQTVLSTEYDLLNKNNLLQGKYLKMPQFSKRYNTIPASKVISGDILLGNSATPTNNHLDVLEALKKVPIQADRQVILPLNYGNGLYLKFLKNRLKGYNNHNILMLDEFLPLVEYEKLMQRCTHAIFGHIRQQAMGNISFCIKNGIKIFLYKDSLAYRHLKEKLGCIIYSIENDLSVEELNKPLEDEAIEHNIMVYRPRLSTVGDPREEMNTLFDSLSRQL